MKKLILSCMFMVLTFSSYAQEKQEITFFYSSHCKSCQTLKSSLFPAIKEKYKDKLVWKEYETSGNQENLALLLSVAKRFSRADAVVPAVLVGGSFLQGKDQVESLLVPAIESALYHKPKPLGLVKIDLMGVFKSFTFIAVMLAGLIDGINPCAFAVIIFFISFLGVYGYNKREMVWVGSFYCLAVFLTYLLIGLGLFKFFYELQGVQSIIKVFYLVVGNFCFLLSIFALYDYYRFVKTGSSDGMILQLPNFLKKRINLVIGSGLRAKKERSVLSLSVTAFVIGFLVSILESVCTGQVYLPTIVFVLRSAPDKLKAGLFLLLYNIMFVLPLLIIFALSLMGVTSQRFSLFLKKHLGIIKLAMVLLFFALGILILKYV